MTRSDSCVVATVLFAALVAAAPARAAESYDNCTGYITSLPATIGSQGTWCMTGDLTTSMSSGAAITVNTHNVTIDCNHFKLGGLQAGLSTAAIGIKAAGRTNTTVRRCNVRGFLVGVQATSLDGGQVVEDSRFDYNTGLGIWVEGDGSMIRNNQILHTGGTTQGWNTRAINALGSVQILDNQIDEVTYGGAGDFLYGIFLGVASGGRVAGNSISGLLHGNGGKEVGVYLYNSAGAVVQDNAIVGQLTTLGTGIYCDASTEIVRDNSIISMETPLFNCSDNTGNQSL